MRYTGTICGEVWPGTWFSWEVVRGPKNPQTWRSFSLQFSLTSGLSGTRGLGFWYISLPLSRLPIPSHPCCNYREPFPSGIFSFSAFSSASCSSAMASSSWKILCFLLFSQPTSPSSWAGSQIVNHPFGPTRLQMGLPGWGHMAAAYSTGRISTR